MLQALKLGLAPPLWRLYCATVHWPRLDLDDLPTEPCIFACLHRDILPAIKFVEPAGPALLVSNSPDGDILVRTLGHRKFRFVRGATGENGQRAFRGLLRQLQAGHPVGVAVDGPKGPFGEVQEGILHLSRLAGAPLRPLRVHAPRAHVLDTWDRTVIPRPFRSLEIVAGEAIQVPSSATAAELAGYRASLTNFFAAEGASHGDS